MIMADSGITGTDVHYDFGRNTRFFIDHYATLLKLHAGKHIVVGRDKVLFVGDSHGAARAWADRFCLLGTCSILEVSPDEYRMLTEGVVI